MIFRIFQLFSLFFMISTISVDMADEYDAAQGPGMAPYGAAHHTVNHHGVAQATLQASRGRFRCPVIGLSGPEAPRNSSRSNKPRKHIRMKS